MSDLTQFRDHARFMASREHAEGCAPALSSRSRAHRGVQKWCGNRGAHAEHEWTGHSPLYADREVTWRCAGRCSGCVTDAERALWTQLADEIDAYLQQIEVAMEPLFDLTKGA